MFPMCEFVVCVSVSLDTIDADVKRMSSSPTIFSCVFTIHSSIYDNSHAKLVAISVTFTMYCVIYGDNATPYINVRQ